MQARQLKVSGSGVTQTKQNIEHGVFSVVSFAKNDNKKGTIWPIPFFAKATTECRVGLITETGSLEQPLASKEWQHKVVWRVFLHGYLNGH